MTRKEAQEQGLLRYTTGKVCKHGHQADRFTSNGVCVDCNADHNLKRYGTTMGRYWMIDGELVSAESLLS